MIKELKVKCDCNSLMEYDSYANRFICPKCRRRYTIKEIDGKEVVVSNSSKAYKMNEVYNKEDFLNKRGYFLSISTILRISLLLLATIGVSLLTTVLKS